MAVGRLQYLHVPRGGRVKTFFYGILICPLLFSLSARFCRADAIPPAMRADDQRLQRYVTIRSPHIQVAQVLEYLSQQTAVTITADDWSMAGSDDVAVSLNHVSLADAMDALWSLFSYKDAEWEWRRTGVKGAYIYRLYRPAEARLLAERLRGQVQSDFEGQAQRLIDATGMPQDQLQEAAKADPLLNSLLNDGRVGPGMTIFTSLPPELQQHILQGNQEYTASVADLPPDAQDAINRMWSWENNAAATQLGRPTDPPLIPKHTQIKIFAARAPGMIGPALFLDTGQGSGEYCGGAFLDDDWRKKMSDLWLLPGDSADNPTSARVAVLTRPALAGAAHSLSDQLLQEADAARVPLIARIPAALDGAAASLPTQLTLATFLKQTAVKPVNLDHKWRDGVLLVAGRNWFMDADEGARVPWGEVARLRDAEAKSADGLLSLTDLAHAAYLLTPAQLHGLSEWFPVMDDVSHWHDIMAYFDQSPDYLVRVLKPSGDSFRAPQTLVSDQLSLAVLWQTYPNLRLQVRVPQRSVNGSPVQEVLFEALNDSDGKLLNGSGFGYRGHEYQANLQVNVPSPPLAAPR